MKTFIAQPLITEKSLAKSNDGVYQFVVPKWVTKRQIAEYIAKHFNVGVVSVTTANSIGKTVSFRRKPGVQVSVKKATVRVKKGDKIAEFTMPVEDSAIPTPSNEKNEPAVTVPTESTITVRSKSAKKTKEGGA